MKTLKCDLCEATADGETFEEWMNNLKPHYAEAHAEAMKGKAGLAPEEQKAETEKWMAENKVRFEAEQIKQSQATLKSRYAMQEIAKCVDTPYLLCYDYGDQIIAVRESKSGFSIQHSMFDQFIHIVSLTEMQKGTVARLTDRGFGFIKQEGAEKDLFFHSNELKNVQFNDLHEGDELTFEVAEGPKGPSAVNINKA